MSESTYSQSRIAKNTIFLYLRMFVTMAVTLYTSRVVLDVLGVEDYGIYNVIGGFVVLLSIVSNSMTSATQRFLTFELGKGDELSVGRVFSMSMIAHYIICGVILILGETIGLWYVLCKLNIPAGRETAALWVYQISLVLLFLNLVRSPYNAAVIAYEKMSFFAYMSIVDVLLKLMVVGMLLLGDADKLVLYTILVMLTNLLVLWCYYRFCVRKFPVTRFHYVYEKSYFRKLFSFLGWNMMGAAATLGTNQAGNLIINNYLGVAVNAAYGVANQVNGAIYSFVSNFQIAFTPQLIKLFSQNKMVDFVKLSNSSALLSYYLLFLLAFPVYLNIDYVLGLWLVEVPQYTGVFCQLLIIYSLIDAVQAPFWIGINASGNIKVYEIWLSAILLLNIPFSILVLSLGWAPYWVVLVRVILNFVTAIIRSIHVKFQFGFPIRQYLLQVISRVVLVTFISWLVWVVASSMCNYSSFGGFVVMYLVSLFVISFIIYVFGIGGRERKLLTQLVVSKVKNNY